MTEAAAAVPVRQFKVLKDCVVSGHKRKPGETLVMDRDVTPARAEVGIEAGNLKELGGGAPPAEQGK